MDPTIVIRSETPSDADAISEVTIAAFKTLEISNQTEQYVIEALRAAGALTVSLVADLAGRVVGHIAISPVTMSDGSPRWYGLGPVSVLPEHQRKGIGKALIQEGLARLRGLGARGCCLVGHPDYYLQFGFTNASGLGHEGVPPEAFFVLAFDGPVPQGTVAFHEGFRAERLPAGGRCWRSRPGGGQRMASVLVTGASKGIGMATALVLARSGHSVLATMRDPVGAPELARLAAREGLPIHVSSMDVDSDASVAEAIAAITREAGPVEVLVNNAGIEGRGAIEELGLSEFRAVMETNFFGALRCIQAVLPQMRDRRSGCIVNVSSVSGRIAASPLAPYVASKFALEALSEALAQEVKMFNIRVAIVQPGIMDTAMPRRIGERAGHSHYPHTRRMADLFTASLQNPTSPFVAAEKIREIVESGTWQLRHPVGPDAVPFLQWRASMADEEWVDWGAVDDERWYEAVERDFGLDARRRP